MNELTLSNIMATNMAAPMTWKKIFQPLLPLIQLNLLIDFRLYIIYIYVLPLLSIKPRFVNSHNTFQRDHPIYCPL